MTKNPLSYCTCGHVKREHKFHEHGSPEELLQAVINDKHNDIVVIHDLECMTPKGYRVQNTTYYTHAAAINEVEKTMDQLSACRTCNCACFKQDNLKYLEILSERSTS